MKYNHATLSFLFIFTACTAILHAGDSPQATITTTATTTATLSFDQITNKIDGIINSRHSSDYFFFHLFDPQLEEKDMVIILAALAPYCTDEKITEKLFQTLYKKNSLFAQLHNYCVNKAVKNIENVTCDTLESIADPAADQPEPFLNTLKPLILKQYIINKALETVNPTYTMQLIGHTDSLQYADICTATGYAVTSSLDKSIRFWDLNNGGKCVAAFHNEPVRICFNKTGSHFATAHKINASQNQQDCTVIKQWTFNAPNFQPELTHSTETIPLVCYIAYCNDNTLVVIGDRREESRNVSSSDTHFYQTILTFGKKGTTSTLGTIFLTATNRAHICNRKEIDQTPYTALLDAYHNHISTITKKSCPLYLCRQAIKNSPPTTQLQTKIKSSQSYQQLTPYEREMVTQQITAKAAPLQDQKAIMAGKQTQ